jgi:arylsulfatase A-like enzyme
MVSVRLSRRELLLGAAALPALASKRTAERPSILLILVDDLSAWALGVYGSREIRTPNLDILSRSGVRFTNSFVCSPVPAPSRATLLSGSTPRRHGVGDQGQPLAPQQTLLSDTLAAAGYHCGYCGVWDLGPAASPGHGLKYFEPATEAPAASEKALAFLDSQKAGQPFFLTAGYTLPAEAPKQYADLYTTVSFDTTGWAPASPRAAANKEALKDIVSSIRKAAAGITAFDAEVQRLIRKLDDRGLRDGTVVVFTSTCGAFLGRHGLWGDGRATDPPSMYDDVILTPLLWQWLGHFPPETVRPEIVASYDLVPTLCELVGAPLPAGLPGRSYLSAILGQSFPKKRPWISLAFGEYRDIRMARDKQYKLVLRDGGKGPNELYDERTDRSERVNHFGDPAFVSVHDELARDLDAWAKQF